ncbi:MAG: hypothetical protein RBU45_08320 [Myxococcota bacterium]|jgi:hypothetical protein|nr:hypothetical protein [Myxococcota bacterium]
MPDRDWPDWDDDADEPILPKGKKEGTAVFSAVDLDDAPPAPKATARSGAGKKPPRLDLDDEPAPPGKAAGKGELPPDWQQGAAAAPDAAGARGRRRRKGQPLAEEADEAAPLPPTEDDEEAAAAMQAEAEANLLAMQEMLAEAAPAFQPIDLEALLAGIEVFSPTQLLLELPDRGEELPERTQKLVQVRRQEELLVAAGQDPEEAAAEGRQTLAGSWVRIQLVPHQVAMTERICGRPIRVLYFRDAGDHIDRSMHVYTPDETSAMAAEVARLVAYYDVICEQEQQQLYQMEADARVQAATEAKQAELEAAMQAMMPRMVIDPKTAKKNAKMWKNAHPELYG